jgi:putative tryptophan/tyrosine transport system substrate-binding protein
MSSIEVSCQVNRRVFLRGLLGAAALSAPWLRPAVADPAAKLRRLGVLSQGAAGGHPTPLFRAFQQGLRELGWIEGRNLAIEWRFAEGDIDQLPRLAAELVGLPVDLIVAAPVAPALAAKEATGTIPVVFVQVPDPVGLGVVANLARPSANVTGISTIASDLSGKRLALVKEVLPGAKRVAVLWNRHSRGAVLVVKEMERMKSHVGLELDDIGVYERGELDDAFASAVRRRAEAVMVIDDPVIAALHTPVVELAARHALPIFSQYSEYVDSGGLMAYGPSLPTLYQRAATFVDRILKGANPSDLPVEQPTTFELVINLKTANALGLDLALPLVARADRVIE